MSNSILQQTIRLCKALAEQQRQLYISRGYPELTSYQPETFARKVRLSLSQGVKSMIITPIPYNFSVVLGGSRGTFSYRFDYRFALADDSLRLTRFRISSGRRSRAYLLDRNEDLPAACDAESELKYEQPGKSRVTVKPGTGKGPPG